MLSALRRSDNENMLSRSSRIQSILQRDKSRSRIMIKAIDKQLYERRLMRNLEKFVGGKEYEEDFRLLERAI
ncbi:hypothetical protein Tco_0914090 [Tanacetum coccineum]